MMEAYKIETIVQKDGSISLDNLPFRAGANIEIIILAQPSEHKAAIRYPLRGQPVTYTDPTAPVAQSDWDITG